MVGSFPKALEQSGSSLRFRLRRLQFGFEIPGDCLRLVNQIGAAWLNLHDEVTTLENAGHDIETLVANMARAFFLQVFRDGFFHADLHPGNLRFLPPGRIVALDLGLVGEIDDHDRLTTARLLFALSTGDGLAISDRESVRIEATRDSEFLLFDLS